MKWIKLEAHSLPVGRVLVTNDPENGRALWYVTNVRSHKLLGFVGTIDVDRPKYVLSVTHYLEVSDGACGYKLVLEKRKINKWIKGPQSYKAQKAAARKIASASPLNDV